MYLTAFWTLFDFGVFFTSLSGITKTLSIYSLRFYTFNLLLRQCLLLGCVLTRPRVFATAQIGTGLFCFVAFASLTFLDMLTFDIS
jgi:hypothetical protein